MLTGILLAGGKATRMGKNKAFLPYKNKFLFEYPLSILTSLCGEVLISGSDPELKRSDAYLLVPDEIPASGPAGGILTCLKAASNEACLVLSCDMPFMKSGYFAYLLAKQTEKPVAAGIRSDGTYEPLAGIYTKKAVPALEKKIKEGKKKLSGTDYFDLIHWVDLKGTEFDLEYIFLNINTPEAYQRLLNT